MAGGRALGTADPPVWHEKQRVQAIDAGITVADVS
jgi:hypothetical protein